MINEDWSNYYEATKGEPPSPLLLRALDFVREKQKAIDIGGGPLNDAIYLINEGFDVTVIDKSPLMETTAKSVASEKLHTITAAFEDFDFPKEEYDLASGMFTLPFILPEHFNRVFTSIKNSLKIGGIFSGQFFGDRDEWKSNPNMTFHTKEQVEALLADLEVIVCKEREIDGPTAVVENKHSHIFYVIARKV